MNLGIYDDAMECVDKALTLDQTYKYAWYNRGWILSQKKSYEEAIEAFDKALAIDPSYKHAWLEKGIALHWLGRYEEALECYNKTLEIDRVIPVQRKIERSV